MDMTNPNQSQVELLVLVGFKGVDQFRYWYFCVTLVGYLLIVVLNVCVVLVICVQPSLHQPMYVFLSNLLFNTLLGCAAFYPKLLHDFLCDVQLISRRGCIVQAFCVHVYVAVESNILMVMAFDRYVAIAHPLTYPTVLSSSRVYTLLTAAWTLPVVAYVSLLSLTSQLPLCASHVNRTFCDNRSVMYLSCVDISMLSLIELVFACTVVFLPMGVIFCCYVQILTVSFQVTKSQRTNKALSTCIPHLVTYVGFVASIVFEIIQPALVGKHVPHAFRVMMQMEGFLVLPLLNPLIYGVKLPGIRDKTHRNPQKPNTDRSQEWMSSVNR
uniref:Olfactory receptor 6N1-like n=1 Tax=Sphaeramia orbicularis TaxID=375764 RepID=A0A672YEF8_9TELE